MVQAELARRKELSKKYSCNSVFSSKIVCGDYDEFFGSKVWHGNSKYKRTIWQCNNKFKGDKKCRTPHLYGEDIKTEFIKQFNKLIENKDEILDNCRLVQATLTDCTAIDMQIFYLQSKLEIIDGLTRKLIRDNATNTISQEEYVVKYDSLVKKYNGTTEKLITLQNEKHHNLSKRDAIGAFIFGLMERDEVITEFDERLFGVVVERVIVSERELVFEFKVKVVF